MTKISGIYTELYGKTPEAIATDTELSDKIKEEILDPVEDFSKLTRQECEDRVFFGSSYGQKQGFESGFKYAMALIFESLVC